jgi:hypothetical protein
VTRGVAVSTLPELQEMQPIHGPAQQGALAATGAIKDWRPEDAEFWSATWREVARRNLWISVALPAAVVCRLDGVVSRRGKTSSGWVCLLH